MKSIIPKLDRLSDDDWGNRRDIFYKCPICDTSFRIFGKREKFCHNCGQKINWEYVPDFIDMSKIDITNIQLSDIQQMIYKNIENLTQKGTNYAQENTIISDKKTTGKEIETINTNEKSDYREEIPTSTPNPIRLNLKTTENT